WMRGLPDAAAPELAVSLPVGSVRLTERAVRHDPPTDGDRRALEHEIDAALDALPELRPGSAADLVGIAGTMTTLSAIHLGLEEYDADQVHGCVMSRPELCAVVERLGGMTQAERLQLPGLDPRRADVIFAGGVISVRVVERGGFDALIVSDRGI